MRRLPALGLEPSLAIGVGQSRAIRSKPFSSFRSPPRLRKLSIWGVGQSLSNSVRFPPLDRVPEQARGVGQFVSFAACEDEQPLALVRRADFRRREEACRKSVAHANQSCGDLGESEAEMMGDILEKDERRPDLADDAFDVRPEVAWVFDATALAGDRERLARIARNDDIHHAAPRAAVEAGNIVPERRTIQGLVFHPRHESGRGVGFPFDMAHSTISGECKVQPEVEPPCAGTEREAKETSISGFGIAPGGR